MDIDFNWDYLNNLIDKINGLTDSLVNYHHVHPYIKGSKDEVLWNFFYAIFDRMKIILERFEHNQIIPHEEWQEKSIIEAMKVCDDMGIPPDKIIISDNESFGGELKSFLLKRNKEKKENAG